MNRFAADVREPGQFLMLRNDANWYDAMMTMLAKFAVNEVMSTASREVNGVSDRG